MIVMYTSVIRFSNVSQGDFMACSIMFSINDNCPCTAFVYQSFFVVVFLQFSGINGEEINLSLKFLLSHSIE